MSLFSNYQQLIHCLWSVGCGWLLCTSTKILVGNRQWPVMAHPDTGLCIPSSRKGIILFEESLRIVLTVCFKYFVIIFKYMQLQMYLVVVLISYTFIVICYFTRVFFFRMYEVVIGGGGYAARWVWTHCCWRHSDNVFFILLCDCLFLGCCPINIYSYLFLFLICQNWQIN